MGIPKLIWGLEPFAEKVVLGGSASKDEGGDGGGGGGGGITPPRSAMDTGAAPFDQVESLVIDGPSLVYHVYYRLLALGQQQEKPSRAAGTTTPGRWSVAWSRLHPLQLQPSYAEINRAVLAFITYLQDKHGVEIQKIYFDGALPAAKSETRLSRMEDGRRKLMELRQRQQTFGTGVRAYRNASGAVSPAVNSHDPNPNADREGNEKGVIGVADSGDEALFKSLPPLTSAFKSLPPPPFLVPAAIEYLRTHLVRSSTTSPPSLGLHSHKSMDRSPIELVPAEADPYCAAHSKRTGAAILTADSDLLAYNLGSQGSVIILKTVELSIRSDGGRERKQVLATRFHAPTLASRLGIPCSLQRWCFERLRDPAVKVSELRRRCREPSAIQRTPDEKDIVYGEFLRQYSTDQVDQARSETGWLECRKFGELDPRLAELVIQLQRMTSRTDKIRNAPNEVANEEEERGKVAHVYLPILLEDPIRDSGWNYGSKMRSLAYALLAHVNHRTTSNIDGGISTAVQEHQRRGTRIASMEIQVSSKPPEEQTQSLMQSLRIHRKVHAALPEITRSDLLFWKSFSLFVVSEQRSRDGRQPPDREWAKSFLTGQAPPVLRSWDDAHSQASLHGVLYSIRMLKQAASLAGEPWSPDARALFEALETLPPIPELMGPQEPSEENARLADEVMASGSWLGPLLQWESKDDNSERCRRQNLNGIGKKKKDRTNENRFNRLVVEHG